MAVQPQTPYKEYTANGSTKSFALEFDCYNQDHLIVLVDDVEEIVGTWSLSNGAVVFGSAPASGKKITIQRNTPFRRDGDFQSYDNSFRPGPVNKGFDWIWLKLQELGVADWILSTRINDLRAYVERQDSVLQENIDNLKTYVDDRDDELRAYLLEEIRKQGVALDQLDEYYNYLMQRLAQIAVSRGWDASFIADAGGSTQQDINDFGGAKWRNKAGGYALGATVKLDNGDIVKSTISNNTNNPNVNMMGWYFFDDKAAILTVESVADLETLEKWSGRIVHTKGFYTADNFALAQPYVGGADYIYLEKNSNINDGHGVFGGWTLIPMLELNVLQVGAKANFDYSTKTGTDVTQALKYAIKFAQSGYYTKGVYAPSGTYLFSDELNLTGLDWTNSSLIASREWGQNTAGCYLRGDVNLATRLVFNPATKESVGISIRGGSGASSLRHIQHISILPFSGDREDNDTNERNGIALLLQDCCFSHIHDVFVGAFNVGVRLNNYQIDGFTEFNRFSNVRIDMCDIDVDYLISSENNDRVTDSFHGNSWESTQLQVRQGGGIAVRVKRESSSGVPVNCYHNKFDLNIFGGTDCIAFELERGVVRSAYGDIRAEGPLTFISKDTNSWFDSTGSYQSISDTFFNAPQAFSDSSRVDTNFAFRFNNLMKPDQKFSGANSDLSNTDALKPISVVPQFSDRPFIGQHQDSGLMFVNRLDDIWGWGFAKFQDFYGNPKNVKLSYRMAVNGDFKYYGDNFTLQNSTYGLQFSANFSSFMPQQSGQISLGISQLYYKDVFTQNAVTVVSDIRYKTEISELTEQELQCAIACSKLYRKYKLNAAVDEKGINSARYHVGVIAQEVVQCFTDHNLDWRKYGIITYEKWDAIEAVKYQAATYDENGEMLTPEIQAVEGLESGEIYMVRYDELNCFINAGLEYRLSQLE